MTGIRLPAFWCAHVKAWPKHENGGRGQYLPLRDLLTRSFRSDAHFAQYENPEIERRLCGEIFNPKHAVALENAGGAVRMVAIVFDVDTPDHGPVSEEWRTGELAKFANLPSNPFVYFTRHGYRIVSRLAEPMLLRSADDEKRWTDFYLQSVAVLKLDYGINADPLGDWARIFRAPHATRDDGGKSENLPTVSNVNDIGVWGPVFDARHVELAKTLRKKQPKPRQPKGHAQNVASYVGLGVIGELLRRDGLLGEQVEPGVYDIKCKLDAEHSKGEPFDGSVRYYEPSSPGHVLGAIDCFHTSHGHDLKTSQDWLECWTQDEIDAARIACGLQPFKPKPRTVHTEGAMPPVDFDELPDDPNGPDGIEVDDTPAPDPHQFGWTDLGNAERLASMHGDNIRYCADRKKWFCWNGRYWEIDNTGHVDRLANQVARSIHLVAANWPNKEERPKISQWALTSESEPRLEAMKKRARVLHPIPIKPEQLDADPWKFCVDNGTIDLRTGKLLPHHKGDLITRASGVKYDPKARSEVWDRFVSTATNGDPELAAYMQRAVGYALQGTVTEKKFFFIYGEPDGGKSTFINAISGVFGAYHEASSAETWICQTVNGGNRGDIIKLVGSRLVTAVEFRQGAKFDEGVIKKVTGGDAMSYAKKYEDEINFTATFTLWFAANDPPSIHDNDEGMWSRVARIPFTNILPADKRDSRLREKLADPKAQSAILAWAVQGCLMWQKEGLGTCAAVDDSVNEYRHDMDRCSGFIEQECRFNKIRRTKAAELKARYEQWCEANDVKPLSGKDFAQRLKRAGKMAGVSVGDSRSGSTRYWQGVDLLDLVAQAGDETGNLTNEGDYYAAAN